MCITVFPIEGFCPAHEQSRAGAPIEARLHREPHSDRFTGMSGKIAALFGYVFDRVFAEVRNWLLRAAGVSLEESEGRLQFCRASGSTE